MKQSIFCIILWWSENTNCLLNVVKSVDVLCQGVWQEMIWTDYVIEKYESLQQNCQ